MVAANTTRPQSGASKVVFAIVAIVSSASLLPFLNKSVWKDEGASLYSSRLSWASLWHESQVVDRVLLPYYALLHVWLEISYNIEWARVLSLLAFGLTLYVVGLLAHRVVGMWCALLAVVLTCTNPLMVTSALDARPYALAALAAVLSVAALLKWFDDGGIRFLWLFSLFAVATALLQLFAVLAPLSALAACVALKPQMFRRHWQSVLPPITALVVVVAAFLALVAHQQGQVSWIPGLGPKLFFEDLEGPASSAAGHLYYPALVAALGFLALVVCIAGWLRHSFRLERFEVDRVLVYFCVGIVPTVILVLITLVKPIYVDRYVTSSAPELAIAVALLTSYALRALKVTSSLPTRTVVAVAVVAALAILAVNSVTVSRSPLQDLKGAAQYIIHSAHPSSEVAVPGHFLATGVGYYLVRGDSPLRLWPHLSGLRFNDALDLNEEAKAFASAPNNLWLVDDPSQKGMRGFIEDLREHGFTRVNSQNFYQVSVIHFLRDHKAG